MPSKIIILISLSIEFVWDQHHIAFANSCLSLNCALDKPTKGHLFSKPLFPNVLCMQASLSI